MIKAEAQAPTHSLTDIFRQVRNDTIALCIPLQPEDYIPQPAEFVSPPKWHLAHTTWFFEAFILERFDPGYRIYDKAFSYLFNSYYNSAGERIRRDQRGLVSRPSTTEVYAYRGHVDEHMTRFLSSTATAEALSLVKLGINHEQQHQELLITDLKYSLNCNPLKPIYAAGGALVHNSNTSSGYVEMSEGIYDIGHSGRGFCYDNELGRHKVFLHPYRISKACVTNGEYLDFIADGGYRNFSLWLDEGWAWVQQNNIEHPLYWVKRNGLWQQFTLAGTHAVNPEDLLVHINFYEASAYAEWKGMRLPTEFEWEAASGHLDWGTRWEWTGSAYLPYPYFKTAPGAIGEYNGKFMINQMVLRGASVATAKGHSRNTYRNFFHPAMRWQFSGIRLAEYL